jgi:glycosyltransferase involved in cell wall biosynthesis
MSAQGAPLVSIVLPTYKRAHVLPLAIRSVLAQTYSNWELVIVSDNSPDNTEEVVKAFDDRRIRYFRNDPNLRLPRTLNRGFSLAAGDYLTWTSDDNMLAPEAIARMVEVLNEGEADFVFADYHEFADTDAGRRSPWDMKPIRLPDVAGHGQGQFSIGACFMYTRTVYERIGDYDPDLFLNEDYDYWMRIARRFRIKHIPELLYYFRRDEDSLYCSRFAEVRAGSLLVRYKNHFLTRRGRVRCGMTDLDHGQPGPAPSHPLVRHGYLACKRISYRLTQQCERLARRMTAHRLARPVREILTAFDGGRSFNEVRLELKNLMERLAIIEYRDYVRAGNE